LKFQRRDHNLKREQLVPRPRPEVFAFFADAANLERITPPALRFEIITPLPIVMAEGTRIDYRLRLFGVPFRWRSLISHWNPEESFVDEQLSGPYALWVHKHTFIEQGDRTLVRDEVRYRLPLAPLGDLSLPLVRLQLARIFDHRARVLRELFGDVAVACEDL
jgi:ligand-binding SRPBCC domain-containing protein